MLMQATTRSEINKINGSKGGRPRKDGQPPGQRHLLLPIDGGVAMKTEKTKLETEPGEIGSSINNKDNKESFDLMKTGSAVLDAAGIDPVRWMGNYQPVANWLRLGATPEMIVEVVVEVMARSPKKPEEIHSLGYFEAAVKQRIAQQPQKKPDYEKAWQRAYDDWEITGRIGPAPRVADFRRGEAA
ncbi:MAG: hypothetical protein KGH75_13295 [Rhodospirillales bacterium]|nr:hypothetical protein [Rhodospirillales bacterium]